MSLVLLLLQFVAGFVFLVGGAELLVRGAGRIAKRYNLPDIVIGLTIVAFGTSLPELVVSLTAALSGDEAADIAIGNIIGSNIANIGLVLGLCGLIAALYVKASFTRREVPILIGVTVIVTIASIGGAIGRIEGVLLTIGLIVITFLNYRAAMTELNTRIVVEGTLEAAEVIDDQIVQPSRQIWFDLLLIVMGMGGLVMGANWLVTAADQIATALGVPDVIIGLTLVAIGTSLPEVATSVVAVFRGNTDIAIGNIIGSNLFNLLGIAGITAIVRPIEVPSGLTLDFLFMNLLTLALLPMVWRPPHDIKRKEAALLLGLYVLYIVLLVIVPEW